MTRYENFKYLIPPNKKVKWLTVHEEKENDTSLI